ncbi:hypothetical protein D7294_19035 [Streptomyces hoynatensis]|uniref:Uncharacterized protein n=1 Tax=Streptomyces hoynatensis TaxID=1141874 RepID=A0A3A9YWN1_9ACTN|nr:hypothetical protein D7294_19035 [Streptomyces hoynatensis]
MPAAAAAAGPGAPPRAGPPARSDRIEGLSRAVTADSATSRPAATWVRRAPAAAATGPARARPTGPRAKEPINS